MSPCFNLVVDLQLRCINWSTRASGSKSLYPLKISLRSLRSRRLEVVGTRKNGAPEGSLRSKLARKRLLRRLARRRHPSRVSLSRARSLFRPLLLRRLQILHTLCFSFLLGITAVQRFIWPPSTKERTSRAGLIVYAFECTSAIKGFKYRTPCRCLLVRTVSKRRLIKENCSSFSICKSNCENLGFGDRDVGGRDW